VVRYSRTNDPDRLAQRITNTIRLAQRITNTIQMETRTEIQHRALEEVRSQYESTAARVQERVKNSSLLDPLGVELLSVHFVAAKPMPEVAKALEAEYRETLLRKADMAISARRAAAVEEERKIKENELNTEITLGQQRRQLIDLQGSNALQEATNQGRALEEKARYRNRVRQTELELFMSKTSGAEIVHGTIAEDQPLKIVSKMPQNGVIFSDGIEEDRLDFNSGAIAEISLANRTLSLVVPLGHRTHRSVQQQASSPRRAWRKWGSRGK